MRYLQRPLRSGERRLICCVRRSIVARANTGNHRGAARAAASGESEMSGETSGLAGVDPRPFWSHFEAITKIARPSRHEEAMIEHVRVWAAERGLTVRQDSERNLVIPVPAREG